MRSIQALILVLVGSAWSGCGAETSLEEETTDDTLEDTLHADPTVGWPYDDEEGEGDAGVPAEDKVRDSAADRLEHLFKQHVDPRVMQGREADSVALQVDALRQALVQEQLRRMPDLALGQGSTH